MKEYKVLKGVRKLESILNEYSIDGWTANSIIQSLGIEGEFTVVLERDKK